MFPLLALLACHDPAPGDSAAAAAGTPSSARLHRLTQAQYRASAQDLTGVTFTGSLPDDYQLYGYTTVGGSEATLAPVELEEVEAAAWDIALAAVPDSTRRDQLVGCAVDVPLGAPPSDATDTTACVRGWIADFGRRAWRRPLTGEELTEMAALYTGVAADMDDPTLAVQATVAAFLLSPAFVYRVELGEEDPERPGVRRLTGFELAARMALFLTNAAPDEALLLAAERGDLATDEGLRQHAERLLDSDRGRATLVAWWDETMGLYDLDAVSKDATMFPQFTESLRAAMREEEQLIFAQVAIDEGGSMRDLFTTDAAWVNAELGAIYGLDVGGTELIPVTMPAAAERGGVLGRAAFLTLNANATYNSPTHRGKDVRSRLLCQDIPPPPAGVPPLATENVEGTLRDRLEQHMSDPSCNSCHVLTDPIGFGFEHFDPIGQWQTLDNGLPVDATGDLDGVAFDGAAGLGEALAGHSRLADCLTRQLYRYGKGELESAGEEATLDALVAASTADGLRLRELVLNIVLSDGFRTIGAPAGEACEEEGAERACATACGAGMETCVEGQWVGCDAPAPSDEVCDGVDNDCDGPADEDVYRPCDAAYGPGTQACLSAQWQACAGSPPPREECNGLDDDGNGTVDDGLPVFFHEVSYAGLAAAHESCDVVGDPDSGACHAAVHRTCAASGCGTSGFAVVDEDEAIATAGLACLDASHGVVVGTTYTELRAYHGGCTSGRSPDCNAAVNRFCAARGQSTGYGPVEYSGDTATVVCTPGAAVVVTGYSTLVGYDSVCDGATERMGDHCNRALHRYCQALGYRTGFGPLENDGDTAYAACLGGS